MTLPAHRTPADLPPDGDQAVRLLLRIPQAALPKKLILPPVADPWQTYVSEHDTFLYRFELTSQAEVDAAIKLVYAWGLKWDRILVLGFGVPLYHNYVGTVLTCLRKSYAAKDARAHCWTGMPATTVEQEASGTTYVLRLGQPPEKQVFNRQGARIPDPRKAPIWLHPCRYARGGPAVTTFHPASLRAQIEAGLVQAGCRWCPRLDDLDAWEHEMWGKQAHGPYGPIVIDDGRI